MHDFRGAPWPRMSESILMHMAMQDSVARQFDEICKLLEETRQEMLRDLTDLTRWDDDGGA